MRKITDSLFIGTTSEIMELDTFVISLSAKYHRYLYGNVTPESKNYLIKENEQFVSVNLVDGQASYFDYKGEGYKLFSHLLDLIESSKKPVLLVCDKGHSRSPSLAMLYLAKRKKTIPGINYTLAKAAYKRLDKEFLPENGIEVFLLRNWHKIH